MDTKVLLGAAAVVLIGAGAAFFALNPNDAAAPAAVQNTQPQTPSAADTSAGGASGTPQTPQGYTLAEVAAHADASSCWSAINGEVYDLTQWIGQHPGGAQRILSICGKDGSSAFNQQHTGDQRPQSMLATFRIGALAQ